MVKREAILKASRRWSEASVHLVALRGLATGLTLENCVQRLPEFQQTWFSFLTAINCIPEILRQGAKIDPNARQWVGSVLNKAKSDPLLRYVHQARNSETHGLDESSSLTLGNGHFAGVAPPGVFSYTVRTDSGKLVRHEGPAIAFRGNPFGDVGSAAHLGFSLIEVSDERFGTKFPPPDCHLNAPITDSSPAGVAELALRFYSELIDGAKLL